MASTTYHRVAAGEKTALLTYKDGEDEYECVHSDSTGRASCPGTAQHRFGCHLFVFGSVILAFSSFLYDPALSFSQLFRQHKANEPPPTLVRSGESTGGGVTRPFNIVASKLDDQGFTCTVEQCIDLLYSTGGQFNATYAASLDRPDYLRAASSMQWISDSRLAILQDDLNFIALVDIELEHFPAQSRLTVKDAYSIALPRSRDGSRQFQHSRGNRDLKLDLETSVYIPPRYSPLRDKTNPNIQEGFLLAFGSGSSKSGVRDVIILVRDSLLLAKNDVDAPHFQAVNATFWQKYCGQGANIAAEHQAPSPLVVFHAPAFYRSLRDHTEFSGTELNLEGASLLPPTSATSSAVIRLLQRGNGAAIRQAQINDLRPKNAMGEVVADELFQYLDFLLESDGQTPLFFSSDRSYQRNKGGPLSPLAAPALSNVVEFRLGSVDGVRLTFTGSAPTWLLGEEDGSKEQSAEEENLEFVYIAGAEASPDATLDGAVVGTAMGIIHSIDYGKEFNQEDVTMGVYNYLTYPSGELFLHKTEGVTIPPGQQRQRFHGQMDDPSSLVALTVLDMDNPDIASQMCVVRMRFIK